MPTATFNPDASVESTSVDGFVQFSDASWDTTHDSSTGTADDSTGTSSSAVSGILADTSYFIKRAFFLFDTSSLPSDANISHAELRLYVTATQNGDNDGDDWVNVYATTPASNTALVSEDFDQIGTTALATQKDIGSLTTTAYNTWVLNATGLAAIDPDGITKLGIREGHDVLDLTYAGSTDTFNEVSIQYADAGGNDPQLVVYYNVLSGGAIIF